jgi:UDP-glucuronate 4-epimerase
MKILVTGAAGFIGFHLVSNLIKRGDEVIGLDNVNDYYDVNLKFARLKETGINKEDIKWQKLSQSLKYANYKFIRINLEDREEIMCLFKKEKFDKVVNLAAQAGVRYSIENPYIYIDSNIIGFINILEACRHNKIQHLIYASSSSVYGNNSKMPLSTSDNVDHPISLYAATKKSNELMAHTYSHLYGLPTTGLRFFTVYGPWGRPDMALFIFTKSIIEGKPIDMYNQGNMFRDFTYVNDIIEGIIRVIDKTRLKSNSQQTIDNNQLLDPSVSRTVPYKVYNIGNSSPVKLIEFVRVIENAIGKNAIKRFMNIQPGDVPKTWADTSDLEKDFNYKPNITVETGVNKFVAWYKEYFNY